MRRGVQRWALRRSEAPAYDRLYLRSSCPLVCCQRLYLPGVVSGSPYPAPRQRQEWEPWDFENRRRFKSLASRRARLGLI